mmetsp:Transcript_85982/g.135757  ORF Transcript_85982/g.135757 Transcript_85982/m.135757 type:complete len:173 (+) Transcript_85982:44-562(+)
MWFPWHAVAILGSIPGAPSLHTAYDRMTLGISATGLLHSDDCDGTVEKKKEGNWCEEACIPLDGDGAAVALRSGLTVGSCADENCNARGGPLTIATYINASQAEDTPSKYMPPAGCDEFVVVSGIICEAFCVPQQSDGFATTRTGALRGNCSQHGYHHFLRIGKIYTYECPE